MCLDDRLHNHHQLSPDDEANLFKSEASEKISRAEAGVTAASEAKVASSISSNKEKKEPYQNVTAATSSSSPLTTSNGGLFHMEDKKAESLKIVEKKKQQLPPPTATQPMPQRNSVVLHSSGGLVINLMASPETMISPSSSNQVIVHHHHHHHFHESPRNPSNSSSPVAPPSPALMASAVAPSAANNVSPMLVREPVFYSNLSNIRQQLDENKYLLEQSGWYYGALSHVQSGELLSRTEEGTFLVRDSAQSNFLFTLSVQRKPDDGPTSVRIFFSHGQFRLDADESIEHLMPTFGSVLDLIEYYCYLSSKGANNSSVNNKAFHSAGGQLYSPIFLKNPLRKSVPTLAHSARLTVHRSLKSPAMLSLPKRITTYLTEYPHEM